MMTNFIQKYVSLNDKNWFKTGGKAQFFVEPKTTKEFSQAILFAKANALPIFVLGKGANILISDEGFSGLVIHPQLKQIEFNSETNELTAGAGVTISDLINCCLDNNLSGLEEFSGIPGTVGGSVYINIHYYQFLLSDFLTSATIICKDTGITQMVSNSWFEFGYDRSKLHEGTYSLVSATFKLKPISELETAYARGRQTEIIRHREKRYPRERTCGSFFRNFLKEEYAQAQKGTQVPYVAYYLDKVGIKGSLRVGNAVVSYLHANMLVTEPEATSNDVITLARQMQERVFTEFGILPQPECELIGFKEYPLL